MIERFYLLALLIQLVHSTEELTTGFHKKWYLFKMPFQTFLLFEIIFSLFWLIVLLVPRVPNRVFLQEFFLVLMFANGIQHVIWWGVTKKYVPGLITAFGHIFVFLSFYFYILK
ncbi:HXXEE domain-containing protein [Patescibacteria group bacterium]|nr:HXXEE domain-containing protein [Patescibacteria group bacterium]